MPSPNVRALKVALYIYMFLILGGTLALYVLPQWSNIVNTCPPYGITIISYACLSVVLCLLVSQLCADVVTKTVDRLSRFGKPEWRIEHAVLLSIVSVVVLCGVLFQNFYLTYMPLIGLVIYMLLHRHNRAYVSHIWLREFFFMVTSVTFGAIVAPITPIIFAIVAGLLSGRTRLGILFSVAYSIVLGIALYKLAMHGVNPLSVLIPGFAYIMQNLGGTLKLQVADAGLDLPTTITKVFQFMVTNSYIAFLEELLGRATIPFVGPVLPTAIFVSLHVPSRVGVFFSPVFVSATVPEYAIVMSVTTITLIAIAAIFLVRTYCLCGLVPAILVHMIYDTYIDSLSISPIVGVTILLILFVMYLVLRGFRIVSGEGEEGEESGTYEVYVY